MHRKQIEQFAVIADCNTVIEACEKTGLDEEQLRALVAALEEEAGYPLLSPSFAGIKLTKFGKILKNNSERIVSDFAQVESAMHRVAERQKGRVRFGVFATTHCFMTLPQIAQATPQMDFKAIVCAARDIVSGLDNGRIDVAILPATAAPDNCEFFEICNERAYLSVPYTSSLALQEEVTLEDIANEPIFMVSDLHGLSQWYEEIFEASGGDAARVQRREAKDYLSEMRDTPCSHFSTTVTQLFDSSNSGRVEIPIKGDVAQRSVVVVYKKENEARLAPIISFVKEYKDKLYTSRAFLPYLLQPARMHNLDIARDM